MNTPTKQRPSPINKARADAILALLSEQNSPRTVLGIQEQLKRHAWQARDIDRALDQLVAEKRVALTPLAGKWAPWVAAIHVLRPGRGGGRR